MSERSILAKKLIATCPVCQKRIYGGTLGLNELDVSHIKHFPFAYTYVHSHDQSPSLAAMEQQLSKHAITLFFDANLAVRGIEESITLKIDN